jgi:hypothetical protein
VYFANHSLHHVVELESLFSQVAASLAGDGALVVNDMIGRNGHRRWPEAAEIVDALWRVAPSRYRYNHYLGRTDPAYPDDDCSAEGFEGVRAQDILPLLLKSFYPEIYVTFANVVDPFVDRVYGPNFDPEDPQDVAFIEQVARIDDAAIDLRLTTPTHLIGTFRTAPIACRFPRRRSPERTLRPPDVTEAHAVSVRGTSPSRAQNDSTAHPWHERYLELRNRKAVRVALALSAWRRAQWRSGLRGLRAHHPPINGEQGAESAE